MHTVAPLAVHSEPVPLFTGADGAVRVGGTRVTLDSVVAVFRDGATAEEILHRFPTLRLAGIYPVISFHLRHRAEVESYLRECEGEAARLREEIGARFDPTGVREKLLARRGAPRP